MGDSGSTTDKTWTPVQLLFGSAIAQRFDMRAFFGQQECNAVVDFTLEALQLMVSYFPALKPMCSAKMAGPHHVTSSLSLSITCLVSNLAWVAI